MLNDEPEVPLQSFTIEMGEKERRKSQYALRECVSVRVCLVCEGKEVEKVLDYSRTRSSPCVRVWPCCVREILHVCNTQRKWDLGRDEIFPWRSRKYMILVSLHPSIGNTWRVESEERKKLVVVRRLVRMCSRHLIWHVVEVEI